MPLLDPGSGSGEQLDLGSVKDLLIRFPELRVVLAGGLNAENVIETVSTLGDMKSQIAAVDVSSGVETDGKQDLRKIEAFVKAAKSIAL